MITQAHAIATLLAAKVLAALAKQFTANPEVVSK